MPARRIRSYESVRPLADLRGSPHGADEIRSYEFRRPLVEDLPFLRRESRVTPLLFSRFP